MSLVGSLEDLGLGDILQIISLSRKSGLLLLRSDRGEGRIVFQDGLVRGAFVKGGPTDLRGLVVGGGALSETEFDAVATDARARGLALDQALIAHPTLSAERLDDLRRATAESAVVEMFRWRAGDFSFEIRDEGEADRDAGLLLTAGLSAQYLAMEATRLRDEAGPAEGAGEGGDAPGFVLSGEDAGPEATPLPPLPSPTATSQPTPGRVAPPAPAAAADIAATAMGAAAAAADIVAAATALDVDGDEEDGDLPAIEVDPIDDSEALETDDVAPAAAAPAAAQPSARPAAAPPVIALDRELATLEWIKQALAGRFPRVHIFQASEHAVTRLRQYLVKGESPLVLISDRAPADRLSGARDAREIITRIKAQSPRTPVLLLVEGEAGRATTRPRACDGVAVRPTAEQHASPRQSEAVAQCARRLEQTLAAWIGRLPAGAVARTRGHTAEVERLRDASARLRHPSSRGEVLPLVMQFARESFSRVAMFMLRDDVAVGIAQLGLTNAGGPDDAALQLVHIPTADSAWLRAVCERRGPVRAAPSDDGDRRLATLLGATAPPEAYLAPIESGDRVVAVLYADNLPGGSPIGDTHALEVVLHEAGLALDRAVLERALAEAETRGSDPVG